MKRSLRIIAFVLLSSMLFNSCIGTFTLTKKVHSWNQRVGDKYVNELVFLVLVILPVYEATLIVDGLLLNSIEFWTGDNPLAMNENDIQQQRVSIKGQEVEITATKNRFHFEYLSGKKTGQTADIVFNEVELSWELHKEGKIQKLSKHSPYNKVIKVVADAQRPVDVEMPM